LLDLGAERIGLCLKMVDREGEQPEVVVMRPVAMGRTRAAIASFAEIVTACFLFCAAPTASSITVGGRS
jgi:hypothetical protein